MTKGYGAPLVSWKSIPGFSLYQASTTGLIRRIGRRRSLCTEPNHGGYLRVRLHRDDGKLVKAMVHVLVLMAWVGPRPTPRHHGAHCKSNDKRNNRLDNLEWKLPEENEADKKIHGTAPRGGRTWRPNWERVARIRDKARDGKSYTLIAREEGMHRYSVSRIVRGLRRRKK